MDFALIEADFQQYYNLDLTELLNNKFTRYCRLLHHLPFESRFAQKYLPSKDWTWEKETQARILNVLDALYCHVVNMTKSKGQPSRKIADLFQPDYVKAAKEEAERQRKEQDTLTSAELSVMKDFWKKRNYKAKSYVD